MNKVGEPYNWGPYSELVAFECFLKFVGSVWFIKLYRVNFTAYGKD